MNTPAKITPVPAFEITCPYCECLVEEPVSGEQIWLKRDIEAGLFQDKSYGETTCQECDGDISFSLPKGMEAPE